MKHAVHGNHLLADPSISKRNDALQEACGMRTNTEKRTKKLEKAEQNRKKPDRPGKSY
jgi:hypothetical protein